MYIQSGELVIILKGNWKKLMTLLKSMKIRIVLLLILVSSIPCLVIKSMVVNGYEKEAVSWRIAEIQEQCTVLSNQLSSANYLENQISDMLNAELNQLSNVYDGRVMVIDKDFRIRKDTFGTEEGKIIVSSDVIACFETGGTSNYNKKQRYIDVTTPIVAEQDGEKVIQGVLLVTISTNVIENTMESMASRGNTISLIILIVVASVGLVIAGKMVKPFEHIVQSIEDVTAGYENENLEVGDYTETQAISDAFNKMLGRLRILDDSRQEFVSNVSHELKTPLTSMKVLADSLISQENVPVELYQEFMTDIADEIERENKIINDLLSLVKLDKTNAQLNVQSENINEVVERILKRLRPIAALKNVELTFESFRPVMAEVDEVKLSLAISNLVENAIKYNHEEGWVRVSLNADHKYFYIKVSDSGMGIPEEDQEHIFERFFRVDKSHSREIGGTGLGLAIARNAILVHRGAVKVYSEEGQGTTFTVRIPLNYIV